MGARVPREPSSSRASLSFRSLACVFNPVHVFVKALLLLALLLLSPPVCLLPGSFSCDPRKAALRGGIGGGGGGASAIGGAERGDAMADAIRAGAGRGLTRGREDAGRSSARWR